MKKKLSTLLLIAVMTVGIATTISLTSCEDNDGWYPAHPASLNFFYDPAITGYWQLVQVNGAAVPADQSNYLYFNGNGRGLYYYLSNGKELTTGLKYNCQGTDSSVSRTQLNIDYNGVMSPRSMVYWVNNSYLWMQWRSGNSVTTYMYKTIYGAPW